LAAAAKRCLAGAGMGRRARSVVWGGRDWRRGRRGWGELGVGAVRSERGCERNVGGVLLDVAVAWGSGEGCGGSLGAGELVGGGGWRGGTVRGREPTGPRARAPTGHDAPPGRNHGRREGQRAACHHGDVVVAWSLARQAYKPRRDAQFSVGRGQHQRATCT